MKTLVFKNDIAEITRLHDYFVNLGQEAHISEDILNIINLAVEEAVANVIDYAYPVNEEGIITIDFKQLDGGNKICFIIKDKGKAFDPTKKANADINQALEDRPIGGLGITIVRDIMDDMRYERTPDGFNVLTFIKKIK